jgi:hypothetical protein
MSILDHIPTVRIYWDGRAGVAHGARGKVTLKEKPELGFRFVELDYSPGICCLVRRETWHKMDDMQPAEWAACALFIRSL